MAEKEARFFTCMVVWDRRGRASVWVQPRLKGQMATGPRGSSAGGGGEQSWMGRGQGGYCNCVLSASDGDHWQSMITARGLQWLGVVTAVAAGADIIVLLMGKGCGV